MRFFQDIGVFGMTVDAWNESPKAFYLRSGFIPLVDNEFSLFIPLKTIQSGFQE